MATLLCMSLMLSPAMGSGGKIDTGLLTLNIHNLEVARGKVHIAIYDNNTDFMEPEKRLTGMVVPVTSKEAIQVSIGALPFGNYAAAIFHDLNDNGKLDKNPFGIPTEPYAFSNNVRAKWKAPTFSETSFNLSEPELSLSVELKLWKDH